jgi:hypothetical protein
LPRRKGTHIASMINNAQSVFNRRTRLTKRNTAASSPQRSNYRWSAPQGQKPHQSRCGLPSPAIRIVHGSPQCSEESSRSSRAQCSVPLQFRQTVTLRLAPDARAGDYRELLKDLRNPSSANRSARISRLRLRFIDSKARFAFAHEDKKPANAVPFNMYLGGFGHGGEDCTFETLLRVFHIGDKKIPVMAEIVHDADLFDEKFGRKEGFGIDEVMQGWA